MYSFGIGQNISFDLTLINAFDCQIFAFDPTPKSINWLKSQELPSNFKYFEYGIGVTTKDTCFYLPINENNVSGSVVSHNLVSNNRKINVHIKSLVEIMNLLGIIK